MKGNNAPEFYEGTGKPMRDAANKWNLTSAEFEALREAILGQRNRNEPYLHQFDPDEEPGWVPEWMRNDKLPGNLADLPIGVLVPPGIYRTPKALADALLAKIYPQDQTPEISVWPPEETSQVKRRMTGKYNDATTEMDQVMNDLSDQLDSLIHITNVLYETLEPYLMTEIPIVDAVNETPEQREDRVAAYSRHAKELDAFTRNLAIVVGQLQALNMRVMV